MLGKLEFDRRWTYQGSLTTPPFSEGVLWNVLEQTVPIRQKTYDGLVTFKEVEDGQVENTFDTKEKKMQHYADIAGRDKMDKPECKDGDCDKRLFRTAFCNRAAQDVNDRVVYHIDYK